MNLIVTNRCNRRCPYCFAREHMDADPSRQNISLSSYETFLNFLHQSNSRNLKLLGGEPTTHPDFPELVQRAVQRNFSVTVFTNGIWSDKVGRFFNRSETENVKFVVNCNHPDQQSAQENQIQERSLAIAASRARIGFNIHCTDFDLMFVADLIERHGLQRSVRLGIACPIFGSDNAHISVADWTPMGERLVRQLKALEKQDVLGALDCGFTMCMFPDARLADVVCCTDSGYKSVCRPVVDIGPDLSIWPCFPLSRIGIRSLLDFNSIADIQDYYLELLRPLYQLGASEKCITCKYKRRRQCSGGCLAHTVNEFQKNGDPRFTEKFEMISDSKVA